MKYTFHIFLYGLGLLASCSEPEPFAGNPGRGPVPVSVTLDVSRRSVSSETGDDRIEDLNLWFFNRTLADTARHYYHTSTDNIRFSLPAGQYEYYAIANAGEDLGQRTQTDLDKNAVLYENGEPFVAPPMTAHAAFTVVGRTQLPIVLTRATALVELDLSVDPSVAEDISIYDVQLIGAPASVTCFRDNTPEEFDLTVDYRRDVLSPAEFSGSFYLFENLAGENTQITDARQKNKENAPRGASCLRIGALCNGVKSDFFVFPGANSTTDFNIRRNQRYRINAVIKGNSSIDARMSSTEFVVSSFSMNYPVGREATGWVAVYCSNDDDNYVDLTYRILKGDGTVRIDDRNVTPGTTYRILSGPGDREVAVTYSQSAPGQAEVECTVTDRYGYSEVHVMRTTFTESNPEVTFTQSGETLTGYQFGSLAMNIRQPGYTGSYRVTTSGPVRFYGEEDGGQQSSFTFPGTGTYTLKMLPGQAGENLFTVTVQDDQGKSVSYNGKMTGVKTDVRVSLRMETVDGRIRVYAEASAPVGAELDVYYTLTRRRLSAPAYEEDEVYESYVTLTELTDTGYDVVGAASVYTIVSGPEITSMTHTTSNGGLFIYNAY